MNSVVISIGTSVPSLFEKACEVANKIGVVTVDVGKTACKTPLAIEYLEKAKKQTELGLK